MEIQEIIDELEKIRNTTYQGDALKNLKKFPDKSVNTIVTSPPYWMLRDYGIKGQMGMERTPELYVKKLVKVLREARRVLRDDGTLWLNLGDSYAATSKARSTAHACRKSSLKGSKGTQIACKNQGSKLVSGLKQKDLVGIPWMVAFALRADGWYLRQDIIWSKPNPMPESVNDRCTKAHEYIFLLSKSPKYYYNAAAIKEPASTNTHARISRAEAAKIGHNRNPTRSINGIRPRKFDTEKGNKNNASFDAAMAIMPEERNKRSVWTVTTQPYKEAHFATFPPELIRPCILAGCPPGGVVLDMFGGSGTTKQVANEEGRAAVLIELNPKYIEIQKKRTRSIQQKIQL